MRIDIENTQELTRLANDGRRGSFVTRGADDDRRTGALWVIGNRVDGTKWCSAPVIGVCALSTIITIKFLVWRSHSSIYFLTN